MNTLILPMAEEIDEFNCQLSFLYLPPTLPLSMKHTGGFRRNHAPRSTRIEAFHGPLHSSPYLSCIVSMVHEKRVLMARRFHMRDSATQSSTLLWDG